MKKKYILLSMVLCSSLAACSDYLDAEKDLKHDIMLEDVFTSRDYTEEWLANAYSYISNGNADYGFGGECPFAFSDDIYHSNYKAFVEKTYLEGQYQSSWRNCYLGIRQATIFIQNVDMNTLFTEEERQDLKAQAYFIRAFYYWKLLQKYGPIPLVPEEGQDYTKPYDELFLPRSTYDECVEFISSQMLIAAAGLPDKREAFNIARPTRGAALAVRAKALLYAASPLMNGNKSATVDASAYASALVDDEGKPLLSAEYDEEKWAKAAAAALDVMNLGVYSLYTAPLRNNPSDRDDYPNTVTPYKDGNFSEKSWPEGYNDIDPFESYRSVFSGELTAGNNPEMIFTRGSNQGDYSIQRMVREQLPTQKAKGTNKLCMTQKQCDAYYMADGTDCSGKDLEIGRGNGSQRETGFTDSPTGLIRRAGVSNQYVGREPRFYASVAYSGVFWPLTHAEEEEDRGQQTFYYFGAGDDNLPTGIGVMKFVRPTDTNDTGSDSHITQKADMAIRYADILLMYAEAVNELQEGASYSVPSWDGNTTYIITRTVDELKKGIQPVRIRAGIPDYSDEVYNSRDLFRAKLKRERQIELMGEGHRYFDLRRWLDADAEESLPVYGCNVEMDQSNRDLFHTPVRIEGIQTRFLEKTYFWPIQIDELYRNRRLTQNPGWQSLKQ